MTLVNYTNVAGGKDTVQNAMSNKTKKVSKSSHVNINLMTELTDGCQMKTW